jgi:hypothetical protein
MEIKRGMVVKDIWGHEGVVVEVVKWPGELTFSNHGGIAVWQSERTDYGADNCEHYPYFEWDKVLTILDTNE